MKQPSFYFWFFSLGTGQVCSFNNNSNLVVGESHLKKYFHFHVEGLFKRYISEQEYRAIWRPMQCAGGRRPGMRGGHQMCIDVVSETIYLIGGYDGNHDLSDLWSYHIPSNQWTLISSDTESDVSMTAFCNHQVMK